MTWWFSWGPAVIPAVLSGLALGAAHPGPGWAGLAWVAPGGILLAAAGTSGLAAFRLGFLSGLAFHLFALSWLLNIPFPAGAVAGWLALSGYLAMFQGVWVWAAWSGAPSGGASGAASGWLGGLDGLLEKPWWRRTFWTLSVAASWAGLETLQGWFLSGFPWNLLGASQYRLVPLIQLASWTGVTGVSFVVVWTSVSVSLALVRLAREPSARWGWMGEVRLPLLLVVGIGCAGMMRLEPDPAAGRQLTMSLVQPDIPQEVIWDHTKDGERFDKLYKLTELALASRPDVVVWPESALPSFSEENYHAVTNLVARHGVWMVFGADDAERRVAADGRGEHDWYNAAFLLDPDGRLAARYRKRHLVIFGEYVPLSHWLPFLKYLTPIEGGFTPGGGPVPFVLREPDVRLSVLICFEDVFAPQTREHASDDTEVLLNLTNNGWFGRGAAQWQHAAASVFRAVETGRPLVRCTNNGLTCWIDRYGRIRQHLGEENGQIHEAGFLSIRVPLGSAGFDADRTFYQRHGEVFGWACLSWLLAGLALKRFRGRPAQTLR